MLKKIMRRKIWKKIIRAAILTAIASWLEIAPAYAAGTDQEEFANAVAAALTDGVENKSVNGPLVTDKQDVYDLLAYTRQHVDTPKLFLQNQCYATYYIHTMNDGTGYFLSAEIERYEKCNDLNTTEIISDLALDGCSELEIALKVHNWLTDSLEYGPSEKTLSACLKTGHGECDDYSMIYAAVMNAAGVETRCMDGIPSGSRSGHMWNLVKIENKWYVCDATWDDSYGNYSCFLKAVTSANVRTLFGHYMDGDRLCNGISDFSAYVMAEKNYPAEKIVPYIVDQFSVALALTHSISYNQSIIGNMLQK